jgi:hypothetical protein
MEPEAQGKRMTDQEAQMIYAHEVSLCNVFGGNVRQNCIDRGVPEEVVDRLIAESEAWDRSLKKFNWDGSVKE